MNTPALSNYYADKCEELRARVKDAEETVAKLKECAEEGAQFAMENGAGDLVSELSDLISAVTAKTTLESMGEDVEGITERQLLQMCEDDEPVSAVDKPIKPKGKSRENRELKRLYRYLCHLLHPDKSKLANASELLTEVIKLYKNHDLDGMRDIYNKITSKTIVSAESIIRETIERYERTLYLLHQEMLMLKDTPGFIMYELWKQAVDDDMAIIVIRNRLRAAIDSIRRRHFKKKAPTIFNSFPYIF